MSLPQEFGWLGDAINHSPVFLTNPIYMTMAFTKDRTTVGQRYWLPNARIFRNLGNRTYKYFSDHSLEKDF
ncbi:MAG: hypothetical protein PUP92_37105 [Rhizonema sp. PD38]|nr:hypothetical protein [Rhizonema sp. PD38]